MHSAQSEAGLDGISARHTKLFFCCSHFGFSSFTVQTPPAKREQIKTAMDESTASFSPSRGFSAIISCRSRAVE